MLDVETKALALRVRAAALLEEAQALDGLLPFAVVHQHSSGSTHYVAWGPIQKGEAPSEDQCIRILESLYEEGRGETLESHELELSDLCGLNVAGRFPPRAGVDDDVSPRP